LAETALASAMVNDISPVGLGAHLVDASYGGDTNYAASVSGTTALIVGAPSYLLSSSPVTVPAGTSGNSTITVTPTNGFTGTVSLQCNGGSYLSVDVDLPTCSAIAPVSITSKAAATTTLTINTQSGTTPGFYTFNIPIPTPGGGSIGGTEVDVTVTAGGPEPAPSFTLRGPAVTIGVPGDSGTATITVTPSNGFVGSVALTCAVAGSSMGAVDMPTCSVTAPAAISGTGPVTATLTISTTAASSAAVYDPLRRALRAGGGVVLAALLFFGVPGRRRRLKTLLGLLLFAAVAGTTIGCGSSAAANNKPTTPGNPGTTLGNYVVTVTGTSGATRATTQVSITVN
jgi:hypothetical protein